MALRVPTSGGPSVRSTPDQTPFQTTAGTSADTFGAAGARALAGVGSAISAGADLLGGIATQQQKENNFRAAKQLDTAFGNSLLAITHGDGGDNPGFYSLRGQAALDGSAGTINSIAEMQKKMLDTVKNPAVRLLFEGTSQARVNRERVFIFKHNLAQRKVADISASQARMKEFTDYAILKFGDDAVLASNGRGAFLEALQAARAAGMDGAAAQSAAEAAQSTLIEGVVKAAIAAGDVARANEVFNAELAAGHIDGAVVPGIQTLLKNANDIAGAQQSAEEAMEAHPSDLQAQLAFAREHLSGQAERDTVTEIKTRFNERATAMKAVRHQAESDASAFVAGGGSLNDFAAANPDQYELLTRDVEGFNRVRKLQDNIAKGFIFARVSDGVTFQKVMRLPDEEFKRLDLNTIRGMVTEREFEKVMTMHRAARKSEEGLRDNPTAFNNAQSLLKRMAPQSLDIGRVGEKDVVKFIQKELRAFVQGNVDNGKAPSQSETAEFIANLLTEVSGDTSGIPFIGDFTFLVAEKDRMTDAQKAAATVDINEIPDHVKSLIARAFSAQGVDPNTVPVQVIERAAAQFALDDDEGAAQTIDEFILNPGG